MKHTFRYILSSFAMLLPALAFAQTELPDPPIYEGYNIAGGVGTKKSVSETPDANGRYTLTLETFATGKTEVIQRSVPADIVLVLDVSGSMEDDMPGTTTYSYTMNQSWTPNLIGTGNDGSTDWWYKHSNGQLYQVRRDRSGSMMNYSYRYYITVNNQTYYLSGTGIQTNQPSAAGANTVFFTGLLYYQGRSKMAALKQAVEAFVNEVNYNAWHDKDGNELTTPVDHQVSVVKFAADRYCDANGNQMSEPYTYTGQYSDVITPGDHKGAKNNDSYNYTEVVKSFTDVSTSTGVDAVVNSVNKIIEGGATASHFGMTKARYLLETVKNRESSKVVVMFTDGIPGTQGWDSAFANGAITVANTLKKATDQGGYGATVYTIGVFADLGNNATNVHNYMNYVSSNYPGAESMSTPNTGSDQGYYQDASSTSADLTEIFKKIASSASSTVPKIEETTQVVDVVSNSFEVPSTTTVNDIVVYTRAINTAGDTWGSANNLTKVDLTKVEGFDPTAAPPATADYMTDEGKVGVYLKDGKLIILGFNYSKADSEGADGSTAHPYGNWVGFRQANVCAGKELVIEFKIEPNPNATGGEGTNTNTTDSGVYVYTEDGYVNINSYEVPHRDLPINIVIEKSGLRAGESATIQIYRCHQKKVNGVVQYNETTGKPLPEKEIPTVGQDPQDDCGWENFTKVILTNTTGMDLAPVTKTLLSLHADYVYLLVEDNWGWAYILDDAIMSTDEVETNPFRFTNTENPDAVKHAEAAAINHFGNGYTDEERVKTYKSSKTILNTNSGSGNTNSGSGNSNSGSE